jgi:hypothetical protein
MSFADGWPRCDKILEMILCRWILSLAYCDLFAAMHILLRRPIALVNPGSSRAHRHTCTCRSGLAIFLLDEDSQGKSIGPWWWFATQTLGNEWKAWSMSLWELIQTSSNNWIQTCFWVWERMVQLWFAVALTGIIPYHTVGALQKKAQGSQTCFRRWSGGVKRLSARSLPGDANDAIRIYCKTI